MTPTAEPPAEPQATEIQPPPGEDAVRFDQAAQETPPAPLTKEAAPEPAGAQIEPEEPLVPKPAPMPIRKPKIAPELSQVTVQLDNVNLTTFLKAITRQTKVNFIVSEGLENKKITAFLDGVTLEEALQVLLGIKGLAYEKIPGKTLTYLITSRKETRPRTITRIFELQHIPLQDIKESGMQGGGEMSQISGGLESGGMSSPGMPGMPGAMMSPGAGQSAMSAPVGAGIIDVLKNLVSAYGRIAVDARTNSLIITDLPENFPQIESLIRNLDIKSPQIMIEAQIVEINSDGLSNLGVDFGGPQGELARFIGPSRYTDYLIRNDGISKASELGHFWPRADIDATPYTGAGAAVGVAQERTGISYGVLSFNEFQILLRAIVTKTRGKVLARPKIMTVNNKPAEIRITSNQAIGIASVSGGLGSTSSSAERQQTGLSLQVIPQVNGDNHITVVVEPKLTRVVPSLVSNALYDPVTRSAKSMVRVRNGDTIVIGGLLDTREEKTVRQVPFLGSLPIIGWLFKSEIVKKQNSELAIFITPVIMEAQ